MSLNLHHAIYNSYLVNYETTIIVKSQKLHIMGLIISKLNFLIDFRILHGDGGIALISAFVVIVILLLVCFVGFVYCYRLKKRIYNNVLELEMRRSSYKELEEETT